VGGGGGGGGAGHEKGRTGRGEVLCKEKQD
jgi:hypothetical protein